MKPKSLALIAVILIGSLVVACNGGASSSGNGGNETNLEVQETSVSTDSVAEPIFINNCGNPASVEQMSEHSQTITLKEGRN